MTNPVKEFGELAKGLAYNPLGIIALFIVLCYAIACLLFGFSAQNLQPSERLPLIWFVVSFPFVVLGTFTWLVVKHHTKLYAPKDFQDSATWLLTLGVRALEPEEQKVKIEDEVAEVVAAETEPVAVEDKPATTTTSQNISGVARIENEEIQNQILISEDLVMREIQAEFGVSIQRQVGLGPDSRFDGFFAKGGEIFAVDVKWIATKARAAEWVPVSLDKIIRLRVRHSWNRAYFILAAVVPNPELKVTAEESYSKASKEDRKVLMLRVYVYDELRKKYGLLT